MPRKNVKQGIARVRISLPPNLRGDEELVCPPHYERHILIKERETIDGSLKWLTYRPPATRAGWTARPFPPVVYHYEKTIGGTEHWRQPHAMGYTGIFVGEPINAYMPAPVIASASSAEDRRFLSADNVYMDMIPYAVAVPKDYVTDAVAGTVSFVTEPLPLEVSIGEQFQFLTGSTPGTVSLFFGTGYPVIPKKLIIEYTLRNGEPHSATLNFAPLSPQGVSYNQLVANPNALDSLRRELLTLTNVASYTVSPEFKTYSYPGFENQTVVDGWYLGSYMLPDLSALASSADYKGGKLNDFSFGFGLYLNTILNQDAAFFFHPTVCRLFWGGYYMLEFNPPSAGGVYFYFFPNGYIVPASPHIDTSVLSIGNAEYVRARQHFGFAWDAFSLKNLCPIMVDDPIPPNYVKLPTQMQIPWGVQRLQPGATYDAWWVCHIRDHVCIFRVNDLLRGQIDGGEVKPTFVFNPVEYIFRFFGESASRDWLIANNGYIARQDFPPTLWTFGVNGFATFLYGDFAETAIATKPTVFMPATNHIIQRLNQPPQGNVQKIKQVVYPGGLGWVTEENDETNILVRPYPPDKKMHEIFATTPPTLSPPAGAIAVPGVAYNLQGETLRSDDEKSNLVGVRAYGIPSPLYPHAVDLLFLNDKVKQWFYSTDMQDLSGFDAVTAIFRSGWQSGGDLMFGEISGYVPLPQEAFKRYLPSSDGINTIFVGGLVIPVVDYNNTFVTIIRKPRLILGRPPIFIAADIIRCPVVDTSLENPEDITIIYPAPKTDLVPATAIENITVSYPDSPASATATVSLVIDERAIEQYGFSYPAPPLAWLATRALGPISADFFTSPPNFPGQSWWDKLLWNIWTKYLFVPPTGIPYRRIIVELGYIYADEQGQVFAVLYPAFDGMISNITASAAEETATGRQVRLTIQGIDILSRLRFATAVGFEPVFDSWDACSTATFLLASAGLNPARIRGMRGIPLGAPLTWWLGQEQLTAPQLFGGYGYPLQNLAENPRTFIQPGANFLDSIQKLLGMSGCEMIVYPEFDEGFLDKLKGSFFWQIFLGQEKVNKFFERATKKISGAILNTLYQSNAWYSKVAIVPIGFYIPTPSWVFYAGPGEYTTKESPYQKRLHSFFQPIIVPDIPYAYGFTSAQVSEGLWHLPTYIAIEGTTIYNTPFTYLWNDASREVLSYYKDFFYPGFRIGRFMTSANIANTLQAKLQAIKSFVGGQFFPPKTMKIVLSVGLPYLFPRASVAVKFSEDPAEKYHFWVIKSVTHTWSAGAVPRTVLEVSVPHWFPIGVPP